MISTTGDGLNILISCDYQAAQDWLGFASWYSIHKNLPDAKVGLLCKRRLMQWSIFNWPKRIGIPFSYYPANEDAVEVSSIGFLGKPLLVIEPWTMAVREMLDEELDDGIYDSSSRPDWFCWPSGEEERPFVDYRDGCGGFVMSEWIHTRRCPFLKADYYAKMVSTSNEARIFRLWKQLAPLYVRVI